MTKEFCDCRNLAVWVYMPGFSSGDRPYFCEECVPRGCDCNLYHFEDDDTGPQGKEDVDFRWIDKDVCWVHLDEKGREYPCSEFDWDPDGFEREINPHVLK